MRWKTRSWVSKLGQQGLREKTVARGVVCGPRACLYVVRAGACGLRTRALMPALFR